MTTPTPDAGKLLELAEERMPCPDCGENYLLGEPSWRFCNGCGWDEMPKRAQSPAPIEKKP